MNFLKEFLKEFLKKSPVKFFNKIPKGVCGRFSKEIHEAISGRILNF